MLRDDVGADVELAGHRVDEGLVSFVVWRVCELHVERLQDVVKCARCVADETAAQEV